VIVEQTYFRWRKEYGGLQVDQAKRLKELEQVELNNSSAYTANKLPTVYIDHRGMV
jgi:hypothetical protein